MRKVIMLAVAGIALAGVTGCQSIGKGKGKGPEPMMAEPITK